MGDKMFETLPSNLGNLGEQNNSKPSHLPYIQSWGVVFYGQAEHRYYGQVDQRHNSAWRGWGKESFSFF